MNEIISVNFDTQTVSARELHEKLNIGTRFNDWFPRMTEYGFLEGTDFYSKMSKKENGGRPSTDYEISVDMAKQICMIQRTPEGKACRQYLIDLEKAWNTPEQIMARALKMANHTIDSLKNRCEFLGNQMLEQQKVIEKMQPKINYIDTILNNKATVLVTQIAQDYGMSAKTFNKKLKELGIQHKVGGQWILYSKYQGLGYVHSNTISIVRSNGEPDVVMQTEWTQKGRLFLYDELKKHDIYPLIEK